MNFSKYVPKIKETKASDVSFLLSDTFHYGIIRINNFLFFSLQLHTFAFQKTKFRINKINCELDSSISTFLPHFHSRLLITLMISFLI